MGAVNLSDCDLSESNFYCAILNDCRLQRVKLQKAYLVSTALQGCDFDGVDFTGAHFKWVAFRKCRNLHKAIGLNTVWCKDVRLDEETLKASVHGLPDAFLRGTGATQEQIEDWRQRYPAPSSDE
jgi:uncharacterized protein YjbI with pentapeptide repeats